MKYKCIVTMLLLLGSTISSVSAQVVQKVGNNAYAINSSAVFEIESSTKGFLPPRLTTAQRNAIAAPATGLVIYNTTKDCLEWYNGIAWYNGCGNPDISTSSNGTAVVSEFTCTTASEGTMKSGVAVSGVTQTITASVSMVGTYSISATANGVTFAGSGTFAGTGAQNIVLTATGTPVAVETSSFVLNTTPSCSFSREAANACGAYVASGVFKAFMCHNLGADTSLDPNVPVQGIHGNYYQWGSSTVVANASTPSGAISGWNSTGAADGSWLDGSKTANDPCPAGFRVPTNAQWEGVIAYNTVSRTGSWANDANNFTTAVHWGPDASTKTLTLPAAGYRNNADGVLNTHGANGFYWNSTESVTDAYYLYFNSSNEGTNPSYRTYGMTVRCISE